MKRMEADWIKIGNHYYMDKFVAFAIEAVGHSANDSQIMEISAVRLENGKIVDRFSSFANTDMELLPETEQTVGMTNGIPESADRIDVVLPRFIAFCEDSMLVTHNMAFAMEFIRSNCERQNISCQFDTLDIYVLAHMILKKPLYTLEAVANTLGVPFAGRHRTIEAAEATAQILYKLNEITKADDRERVRVKKIEEGEEAAQLRILDDMRSDAIAKVRDLKEPALKNRWQRISEAAVEIMVCNRLARREGLLALETQIKYVKDGFLKNIIGLIVDGIEPSLIVEIASNEYWLDEPMGADAIIKYIQVKGMMLIYSCISDFALEKFLLSLIPEKLRLKYDWEISVWEGEVKKKAEVRLKKYYEEFEVKAESYED